MHVFRNCRLMETEQTLRRECSSHRGEIFPNGWPGYVLNSRPLSERTKPPGRIPFQPRDIWFPSKIVTRDDAKCSYVTMMFLTRCSQPRTNHRSIVPFFFLCLSRILRITRILLSTHRRPAIVKIFDQLVQFFLALAPSSLYSWNLYHDFCSGSIQSRKPECVEFDFLFRVSVFGQSWPLRRPEFLAFVTVTRPRFASPRPINRWCARYKIPDSSSLVVFNLTSSAKHHKRAARKIPIPRWRGKPTATPTIASSMFPHAIVSQPWLSYRVDDSLEFEWNSLENVDIPFEVNVAKPLEESRKLFR